MAKRLKKEKVNVDVINFGEQVTSHETPMPTQAQIPQYFKCPGDLLILIHLYLTIAGNELRKADSLHQLSEW